MNMFAVVAPAELGAPVGFSHGLLASPGARLLFVAGQTAAGERGVVGDSSFVAQFEAALIKVLAVVRAAGGGPDHIARLTLYVVDMPSYLASRPRLGGAWSVHMGTHYPAMTVVGVTRLVDAAAVLEIEATAVLP